MCTGGTDSADPLEDPAENATTDFYRKDAEIDMDVFNGFPAIDACLDSRVADPDRGKYGFYDLGERAVHRTGHSEYDHAAMLAAFAPIPAFDL